MKIKVSGFNHKTSKFDKSFDVNTTAEFGFIQPVMCEQVVPGSSYHLSANSQVQLSPLLSPTFARLSLRKFTSFIKMSDVYHHFNELITHRKVTHGSSSRIVTSVPTVPYRVLLELLLLQDCVYTTWNNVQAKESIPQDYKLQTSSSNLMYDIFKYHCSNKTQAELDDISKVLHCNSLSYCPDPTSYIAQPCCVYSILNACVFGGTDWNPSDTDRGNVDFNYNQKFIDTYGSMPTPDDADVVFHIADSSTASRDVCFRFSQRAKNLRKVFIGLGLNIDFSCLTDPNSRLANKPVSILPFLAYYKAWFDLMYPKRDVNFANTNVGQLITLFDQDSISGPLASGRIFGLFTDILKDLSEMTYVFGNDYFSSHLSALSNESDFVSNSVDLGNTQITTETSELVESGSALSTSGILSPTALKLLSVFNNFALSGTVIGKRVNDYLRQFGINNNDDESSFISSDILNIDTGDVLSTTETDNQYLGQKAGQGYGRKIGSKFSYTPKDEGFLISFIAVVPRSSFSQGISPHWFRTDRYNAVYDQRFDGVGYYLTPWYNYFASNNVGFMGTIYQQPIRPEAIGYTARMNDWKYNTNIANGDFTRRPTSAQIGSFYLDKRFPENNVRTIKQSVAGHGTSVNDSYDTVVPSSNSVPVPGSSIRFANNEYFNFNRIFAANDEVENSQYLRRFFDGDDDHFIITIVNDFAVFAPMLPISESLGTTDDINETNSVSTPTELS